MIKRTIIALSAAAAVAAGLGQTAQAEEFRFTLRAFELQTAEGRDAVLHRLDRAASRHCGSDRARGVLQIRAAESCSAGLTEDIVAGIGDHRLSARLAGRDEFARR